MVTISSRTFSSQVSILREREAVVAGCSTMGLAAKLLAALFFFLDEVLLLLGGILFLSSIVAPLHLL